MSLGIPNSGRAANIGLRPTLPPRSTLPPNPTLRTRDEEVPPFDIDPQSGQSSQGPDRLSVRGLGLAGTLNPSPTRDPNEIQTRPFGSGGSGGTGGTGGTGDGTGGTGGTGDGGVPTDPTGGGGGVPDDGTSGDGNPPSGDGDGSGGTPTDPADIPLSERIGDTIKVGFGRALTEILAASRYGEV